MATLVEPYGQCWGFDKYSLDNNCADRPRSLPKNYEKPMWQQIYLAYI